MKTVCAMSHVMRGATARRMMYAAIVCVAGTALLPAAGAAQSVGSNATTCTRCSQRDSTRTRRERLLQRFDSLRYSFEHQRMSDAEREALANEMHDTFMALQQSMGDVRVEVRAMRAPRAAAVEAAREAPAPFAIAMSRSDRTKGYLGLSFDGPSVDEMRGRERIIRFLDYPRIALVEPSSPAERAGIAEGDTLLALDGKDVRDRPFSLTRLLVPNQRIRIQVRREGSPMDFRVVVAEAPGYMVSRMMPPTPVAPLPVDVPETRVRVYSGELPRTPVMPATPFPPGTAMPWIVQEGVAGARLENVTEGLGRALGTKSGVLVLRVAPGSPAATSGLRDGDVILSASGNAVRSVRDVRQALQDADGDEGVKLVVLRERKQRDVTLRW